MKKLFTIASFIGCALLAGIMTSCDDMPYPKKEPKASCIEDLNHPDFRLGLALGARSMYAGEKRMPHARMGYFNSHYAAYDALNRKKIDAYIFDSHTLEYMAATNPEYAVLPGSIGTVDIAIGVSPKQQSLLGLINAFIDEYRATGIYDEMYKRWIQMDGGTPTNSSDLVVQRMPEIEAPAAPERKLVVGVCSQLEPMCYRKPGAETDELIGFDMELLKRLALHLNASYELRDLDYVTMMHELAAGNLDIVVAGLNRTAVREADIRFSKNYMTARIVALVRASTKSDKPEYVTNPR